MSTWREPFIVKRNINQNDKIDNIWNFKINNFSFLDNYKLHKSLEGDISALWEIHTDLWYNVSIKEPLMTRVRFTFPKHLVLIVIEIRVVSGFIVCIDLFLSWSTFSWKYIIIRDYYMTFSISAPVSAQDSHIKPDSEAGGLIWVEGWYQGRYGKFHVIIYLSHILHWLFFKHWLLYCRKDKMRK